MVITMGVAYMYASGEFGGGARWLYKVSHGGSGGGLRERWLTTEWLERERERERKREVITKVE